MDADSLPIKQALDSMMSSDNNPPVGELLTQPDGDVETRGGSQEIESFTPKKNETMQPIQRNKNFLPKVQFKLSSIDVNLFGNQNATKVK